MFRPKEDEEEDEEELEQDETPDYDTTIDIAHSGAKKYAICFNCSPSCLRLLPDLSPADVSLFLSVFFFLFCHPGLSR